MKRTLAAVALAVAALDAGCHGAELAPSPGDVSVRLATGGVAVKAVVFRIAGPETAVAAAPGTGYRVFAAHSGDTVTIAVFAGPAATIASGELVRLSVPDTRRARSYVREVVEVADLGYALSDVSSYALTVEVP